MSEFPLDEKALDWQPRVNSFSNHGGGVASTSDPHHDFAAWPLHIKVPTMAISGSRFFRFLQSIFVPVASIVGFSCLLTFIFVLYQPTPGPGSIQRLGWQSWDTININNADPVQAPAEHGVETGHGDGGSYPDGVDWWNVTGGQDEKVDPASLPLDVWAPLLPHDTGRM